MVKTQIPGSQLEWKTLLILRTAFDSCVTSLISIRTKRLTHFWSLREEHICIFWNIIFIGKSHDFLNHTSQFLLLYIPTFCLICRLSNGEYKGELLCNVGFTMKPKAWKPFSSFHLTPRPLFPKFAKQWNAPPCSMVLEKWLPLKLLLRFWLTWNHCLNCWVCLHV